MTAPSLISTTQTTNWTSGGATKTIGPVSVQAGDIITVDAATEDTNVGTAGTLSVSDSVGLTWTPQRSNTAASSCATYTWTAPIASNGSVTITLTLTGNTAGHYGGVAKVWRGSSGVGNSAIATAQSTAQVSITTASANSAINVFGADWNATSGARSWGGASEDLYVNDGSSYTVVGAHVADSGSIGTYTIGTTTPTGMKAAVIAVEIQGTAGTAWVPYMPYGLQPMLAS